MRAALPGEPPSQTKNGEGRVFPVPADGSDLILELDGSTRPAVCLEVVDYVLCGDIEREFQIQQARRAGLSDLTLAPQKLPGPPSLKRTRLWVVLKHMA